MKMKIDAIDEKSILVELSKEDLSKSEITYEELDYANERTRKLVQRILETIRLETGKTVFENGSLEVEVMPDSFGGCLMIFKNKNGEKNAKEDKTSVFFSENINNFIDCARALGKTEEQCKSGKLFSFDGTYFLLLSGLSERKRSVLSEYLEETALTQARLAFLLEYGKCLIEKDALFVLSA